jgi:hypothetical protein
MVAQIDSQPLGIAQGVVPPENENGQSNLAYLWVEPKQGEKYEES